MDHNGDDEKAWEGWDAETDSSSESSGGWMDVDSDGDDAFNVSDSEDGKTTGGNPDNANGEKGKDAEEAPAKTKKMSTLAATKVRISKESSSMTNIPCLDIDSRRLFLAPRTACQASATSG